MPELRDYLLSLCDDRFGPPTAINCADRTHWATVIDSFLMLSAAREQWESENQFIDVLYTDDWFGDTARQFGLIKHAYEGDAGMDLPIVLPPDQVETGLILGPGERKLLHTGMKTAFPVGHWGFIIHRSSTEYKEHLRVVEGVVDDYRGELLIHAHNVNPDRPITIKHGQKLGQLIIIKTVSRKAREVAELRESVRGDNGFGSSGAKAAIV